MLCLTQKMEKPALKTPDLPETPAFEKPFVPRYRLLKDNKLQPFAVRGRFYSHE